MTAVESAFTGGFVLTGHSANNLLGDNSSVDEAKKYLWLAQPAIYGTRLLWTNEIKTITPKGETFIDGNLLKGIASGGDTIYVRQNFENPYPCRHEFTMFLNCNDLPPVKPAIGNFLLHITFPNVYVLNADPQSSNEKEENVSIKQTITTSSFANGMLWLILDEFLAFTNSGQNFKPIPEVIKNTEDANEAEDQDPVEILKNFDELEFLHDNPTYEECAEGGFFISPSRLGNMINKLKSRGFLQGVTKTLALNLLKSKGFSKHEDKFNFDDGFGKGNQNLHWIKGIRMA